MNRVIKYLLFCILIPVFSFSMPGNERIIVKGIVTDALSGEALAGAHIWAVDLKTGTSANSYGQYNSKKAHT
ncbi:MAG: carboxypeptidase-like regulatory domain-containing protein [Mariniphaga sp.]|nr:carboxypeptidase-like regulatory domain-containing protein [Mariniphaga sp.]